MNLSFSAVPSPPKQSPIWMVEDDESIHEAMQLCFQSLGVEVQWAHSGEETRALLKTSLGDSEFPSLVILDGHLPDAHGIELARLLRGCLPSETEIYLFSADSNLRTTPLRAQGIQGFLQKPLDIDLLFSLVERHWNKNSQRPVLLS